MENHSQSFDVCIICALPEEVRAFLAVVKPHCEDGLEECTSPRYGYSYRSAALKNDKNELLTLHISWLPRYGPQEMTLHLSRVLEECQPRIAIMTGICAGDAQQVRLGDLVVAERTFTYDNGKFTLDEQGRSVHSHDTLTYQLDANILQFLGLFDDWKPLIARLEGPPSMLDQQKTVCHIKAMASGSAVRADNPFQDVQAPVRGTVAIDMEGAAFGLVMSRHPLTRWLIVKGVCDYADGAKNDTYHDYAASASASYALRFIQAYVTNERLPRPDGPSPSSRAGPSPVWNVPYLRNPHFTRREDILKQVHKQLEAGHLTALNGLGGIGKTQIALEYAYLYREDYTAVLWLKADTHEKLQEDARECARLLNLLPPEKPVNEEQLLLETLLQSQQVRSQHDRTERHDSTGIYQQEHSFPGKIWLPPGLRRAREHQQETREKVDSLQLLKKWLENNTQWLLILDNVDDPSLLQDILPRQSNGHILLTTQLSPLGVPAVEIPIEQVTPDEGAQILLKCAQINATNQTEQAQKENQYFAQKFSELVGGLPLALDQAGAYIHERQISVKEYVTLFNDKRAEFLDKRGPYLEEQDEDIYGIHQKSVIRTFEISFDRIKRIDPIAANILHICAFLDSDNIPEEIFKEAIRVFSDSENTIEIEKIENVESIIVLLRYSLLRRSPDGRLYTIHRLLPTALKDAEIIPVDQQQSWAEKTITILNRTPIALQEEKQTTDKNRQQRSRTQFYLVHTRVCATHITKWNIQSADAVELLNRAGAHVYQQQEYAQAQQFYEQLLHIKEQMQGASNLDRARTLSILANLTYLQKDKAKYDNAMQMYKEAIAIYQQELAPDDPHIGQVMSYYALLLRHLKEHREESEKLAIEANKIHVGMTYEAKKRWFGRWAGFHSVEEHETYAGYGVFYLAVIGIPVTLGLLLQSWLWGCGSFMLILVGMIASFLGNKYGFPDKSILLRIVWIFFFLSLSGIVGGGAWIAGKSLLILWQLAHWPVSLQFVLQGVCVLVAVIGFLGAIAITDEFVSFPRYTLIVPTFTMAVSLYALPILSGLLLHSWGMFGLLLFVTWSLYLYIMYSSQNAIPRYRTFAACFFGCIWGYTGWIFAGFLNLHISGYSWQQILPYALAFASALIGFICHNITFANLNFIGGENSVLVLEDLWVDADATAMLNAAASEPIKSWELFYIVLGGGYSDKKRYADAIASYSRAITYTPDSPFYHNFRGNMYLLQGDYTNAIADFNEVIRLDPMYIIAYYFLGHAYIGQGDYTNAITSFNEAIRLDPNDPLTYNSRGRAYFLQNNYTLAIPDLDKAIALDPMCAPAYHNRGNIYSLQNEYTQAIADYTQAIELNPQFGLTYYERGDTYYIQHDFLHAIADYTRAIDLNPHDATAYYKRGRAYSDQGDYTLAIADYDQALNLDPQYAFAYSNRGYVYYMQGDYAQAIIDYTQAIELTLTDAVVYSNRGYAYSYQGDYVRAITDLDKAIELDPEYAPAYSGRGYVYNNQGDYTRAIADLGKAIQLDPKYATAYFNRGDAYSAQNDYARAIADYDTAIELMPHDAVFYSNRGNAYSTQGDYARAIIDFNQAIELDPKYAPAYIGRGNAYSHQGDSAQASADYDFASALEHATEEPNTAQAPNELPAKEIDISQPYEANTSASAPSGTEEIQHIAATAETSFVQNGFSIDGKKVLEQVKQGKVSPAWQVYTDPNIMIKIKYGIYFFIICTIAGVGVVLALVGILHLSWLLWILPVAIALEAYCVIIAGIRYKKTRLVILPEGFVYAYEFAGPAISFHYQTVSEIKVKGLEVTLVLKSGEEQKLSLDVSEAALRSLKNTYLAFKAQSNSQTIPHTTESVFVQSGFSIDGKKVLARVKQGKSLPAWRVYTDPDVTITTRLYMLCAGLLIGGVLVVESLLHLSWHSWLFWALLSVLMLVGLFIIGTYVGSKKTKLVILPEGFVYAFMFDEPDFSFHFDTLRDMIIQEKKVTVVFRSGEQQTTSFSVSEAALQHLQSAYLAFKAQDNSRREAE